MTSEIIDEVAHKPLGIKRKSIARLTAVKALYANEMNEEKKIPEQLALDMVFYYHEEHEKHGGIVPDEKFLTKLIEGVTKNADDIDAIIKRHLVDGWGMNRLDKTMSALLRTAVYELALVNDIPYKVVVSEYVQVAEAFFDDKDIKFVNGILDNIAKESHG